MLADEPDNPYYRSFEGGMLMLSSFMNGTDDRVVYWGTSGEKITDKYNFDSFSMTVLIKNGILLHGNDIRRCLSLPKYDDLYSDVKRHYETIRQYVRKTSRSLYSFGWMLDIARGLYTLRFNKIISKTNAGKWALENELCPFPEVLETALIIRKEPLIYANEQMLSYSETLAEPIQRFADVLENELKRGLRL